MPEEQTTHERDVLDTLPPLFVKSLAEITVQDSQVQKELERRGYTQFSPPYTGFVFDTLPPGLSDKQWQAWSQTQEQNRKQFFADMYPKEKERIKHERVAYESTINYIQPQIRLALRLLKDNKYGLGKVFYLQSRKKSVSVPEMLDIMRKHKVKILKFTEQEIGFDGRTNNGEARYGNGGWTAQFNKNALLEPLEILHELIAIEAFDYYLQNRPSLIEALTVMPIALIVMATGKSTPESLARGRYRYKGIATIPILEKLFEVISTFSPDTYFVKEFSKILQSHASE